jgi:hypothetical protein
MKASFSARKTTFVPRGRLAVIAASRCGCDRTLVVAISVGAAIRHRSDLTASAKLRLLRILVLNHTKLPTAAAIALIPAISGKIPRFGGSAAVLRRCWGNSVGAWRAVDLPTTTVAWESPLRGGAVCTRVSTGGGTTPLTSAFTACSASAAVR